jgi:hypothetical protein
MPAGLEPGPVSGAREHRPRRAHLGLPDRRACLDIVMTASADLEEKQEPRAVTSAKAETSKRRIELCPEQPLDLGRDREAEIVHETEERPSFRIADIRGASGESRIWAHCCRPISIVNGWFWEIQIYGGNISLWVENGHSVTF